MNKFLGLVCILTIALSLRTAHADDGPETILQVDFETAGPERIVASNHRDTVILTTAPNEVVDGKRSLKGDSRASSAEWNEFFQSRDDLFKPGEAYRVSFDYRALARDENAKFYALFRSASGGGDQGWTEWLGSEGSTGHVALRLITLHKSDYHLIIGIRNRGALAINHIVIQTDPANRPLDVELPVLHRTWKSAGHSAYYVDSVHGDDSYDGKSAQRPWRSLVHVNAGDFGPGDRILLRAGGLWQGFLAPGGSGTERAPIRLGRYGAGPKPRIDAAGGYLATLYLFNVECWEVGDLDIANRGKVQQSGLAGVRVRIEDFGVAHHLMLKNLDVHDVSGSLVKSEGGGNGILCDNGGDKVKSWFDGLYIERCRLQHTDRNGITMNGYGGRTDWHPSLHVIIRANRLDDIGGDGIVPIGCDGALIEHNVLRGGRQRCDDYAAGIWPWSCDNTVIQFNEVSGMRGTRDGQGYDSDWNCRNTLFQYNYSHDNEGGFMLICNDGSSKMPWSFGNVGTVIRYNISRNDGARLFQITGPCRNTHIYNNLFYVGKEQSLYAVQGGNWGGDWSENTRFDNNIFYVEGAAQFDFGGMRDTVFEHNVFRGKFQNRPADEHAITADPKLVAPDSGGDGFSSLSGYQLRPDSPCIRAGKPVQNNGARDLKGAPIPSGGPPDIGAFQLSHREPL